MIKSVEVKTYLDYLMCDKCGNELKYTNMTLTSYPTQYPHYCSGCGAKSVELAAYPLQRFEEVVLKKRKSKHITKMTKNEIELYVKVNKLKKKTKKLKKKVGR